MKEKRIFEVRKRKEMEKKISFKVYQAKKASLF